jgi:hypothetical protein
LFIEVLHLNWRKPLAQTQTRSGCKQRSAYMWTDKTGERTAGDKKRVEKEENPVCNI